MRTLEEDRLTFKSNDIFTRTFCIQMLLSNDMQVGGTSRDIVFSIAPIEWICQQELNLARGRSGKSEKERERPRWPFHSFFLGRQDLTSLRAFQVFLSYLYLYILDSHILPHFYYPALLVIAASKLFQSVGFYIITFPHSPIPLEQFQIRHIFS
jgi:hypothetical protein